MWAACVSGTQLEFQEMYKKLRQRPKSPNLLAMSPAQRTIIQPGGSSPQSPTHFALRRQADRPQQSRPKPPLQGRSSRPAPPQPGSPAAEHSPAPPALSARRHDERDALRGHRPASPSSGSQRARHHVEAACGDGESHAAHQRVDLSLPPVLLRPQPARPSLRQAQPLVDAIRVPSLPPAHVPRLERSIATRQYNRRRIQAPHHSPLLSAERRRLDAEWFWRAGVEDLYETPRAHDGHSYFLTDIPSYEISL